MIKNYILSAWRNMMRSKLYTFINIFCLSVGITGAIFIALFLNHESSYDKHHENHPYIYRIDGTYKLGGSTNQLAITAFPLGPAMKNEFSEIKEYVRLFLQYELVVKIDEQNFLENDFYYADSTVFEVFTHEFIYGNAHGALSEPRTVVLTESLWKKYFGEDNPLDQTIEIDRESFRVTGVIQDLPTNSHVRFSALLSMSSRDKSIVYSLSPQLFWNINTNYTYIQLHNETHIDSIMNNMENFHAKYIAPVGEALGATATFEATPLRETHFKKIQQGQPTGNKTNLLIFSVVAMFLIVIAAVNYTNLSTARASKRAREIAMRKVSGATRQQIIAQFLFESIIMAIISLLFSLLVIEIFLPGFNNLTDSSFDIGSALTGKMIVRIVGITLFTGFIAGAYPALYLSSLHPASILKGYFSMSLGSGMLRKALVIFQFTISVLLIASTITVRSQLEFLQNKDLGFTRENRMVITLNETESREKMKSLKNSIAQNPSVVNTSIVYSIPGRGLNKNAVRVQSGTEMVESAISTNYVDHNFLEVFQISLVAGRNFEKDMPSDANNSILINESAVSFFGWTDDPLGKTIQWQFDENGVPQMTLKVIGVVRDFNFTSLHNPIEPLMMMLTSESPTHRALVVEHLPQSEASLIPFLEASVREIDHGHIPNIFPLDHGYIEEFDSEEKLGNIFGVFALVCIIISFLGLFGLSSFLTEQRTKEIGVRKVLGSSGWGILAIFYKEFSGLIFIAILIAGPIIWLLMNWWLQSFVYRITMNAYPILISSILAFFVALVTVSYHTLIASKLNPVDAIRHD